MNSGKVFTAPWSISLKLITLFATIVLISIPIFGLFNFHSGMLPGLVVVLFVLPLAILVISAFFMIRSYEVCNNVLYIQRLAWKTKLDLIDLKSAETDPDAMKGSIRTFGNGGLFCFAGKFRNRKLGAYRALATDPKLAVVLKFPDKVVVVTPESPANFTRVLNRHSGTGAQESGQQQESGQPHLRTSKESARGILLYDLEVQTLERFLSYMDETGQDHYYPSVWALKGHFEGIVLGLLPWSIAMRLLARETQSFIVIWQRLKRNCKESENIFFDYVHAHEKAIEAFATREMKRQGNSTEPVRSLPGTAK